MPHISVRSEGPVRRQSFRLRYGNYNCKHLQLDKEPVTDTCLIAQSNTTIQGIHNVIPVSKYSTLQKLLRVSTYFIHNVRCPSDRKRGSLSAEEIDTACCK